MLARDFIIVFGVSLLGLEMVKDGEQLHQLAPLTRKGW